MTTGRINQISIGADETAERFFRITLGSKRLCFDRLFFLLFFGFESKSKTRFNLGVDRVGSFYIPVVITTKYGFVITC